MIQLATSDEPPAARNGVVRPVSGMTRVTPPITMKTCSATTNERPTPSSRPKSSWPVKPIRKPRDTKSR